MELSHIFKDYYENYSNLTSVQAEQFDNKYKNCLIKVCGSVDDVYSSYVYLKDKVYRDLNYRDNANTLKKAVRFTFHCELDLNYHFDLLTLNKEEIIEIEGKIDKLDCFYILSDYFDLNFKFTSSTRIKKITDSWITRKYLGYE